MSGRLDRAAYICLARQHHAIYTALEDEAQALPDDAVARRLMFPELVRAKALARDLERLAGSSWAQAPVLSATRDYVARIRQVGATSVGYVGHAYTRYLGDLSGGQVVRTMLQRHYGLTEEQVTFYSFAVKAKPFKDHYRQLVDELPFSPAEASAVVAEASEAFELNSALFDDLGRFI